MDTVLKQMERLAALAGREDSPVPLDASRVMARIRGLELVDDAGDPIPLGFFAGGTVAVAAAAVFVVLAGLTAWVELQSPINALGSLPDMLENLF